MSRSPTPLDQLCQAVLQNRREQNLLRTRHETVPVDATHLEIAGKRYINFASNDYLGLSHHPKLIDAVKSTANHFGIGSGAAGLISGYTTEHASAERIIARWKQMESAILLPSGYQANLAAVQTLSAVGDVRFVVDQLAHASLIDAVRASGRPWRVFSHNNLAKLQRLLSNAPPDQIQIVVTESIFSMDGDAADLAGLRRLKEQFHFTLLLDEAHGTGVYGPAGSGYAAEQSATDIVDIAIVTLSKAVGCIGGAICGSEAFIRSVANLGRAWIYSTSIPAMVAAAARAAIQVMHDEPQRQERLRNLARKVRSELSIPGLADSPIIPVILGSEQTALAAAERLKETGMWVVAVRPPTVKPGTSRLRITLSSEHTDAEVERLIHALV